MLIAESLHISKIYFKLSNNFRYIYLYLINFQSNKDIYIRVSIQRSAMGYSQIIASSEGINLGYRIKTSE